MPDIILNDFNYLEKYKEYISRKEFWLEVSEQLTKDFNNGLSLKLDAITDWQGEHVAEIFVKELEKELPTFTPQLSEILYRIDIPESQIDLLKNVPDDIYYRCLAEMILKRIILKVATRKMFSQKNNKT